MNVILITKLLQQLGFSSLDDLNTIVGLDVFDSVDESLVRDCAVAHEIHVPDDECLDAEEKFRLINRILELRYEKFIDSTKAFDELPDGYRIENMPAF